MKKGAIIGLWEVSKHFTREGKRLEEPYAEQEKRYEAHKEDDVQEICGLKA